ncbi:small s [Trichoderma arundinaceum]|uniref:Small s n=1 Tax=Trichoderma arundinaceum TaxID=490622 RepID=A0A395NHY2_TRIAR|nr:small s [Trichoderma arundinaceum]
MDAVHNTANILHFILNFFIHTQLAREFEAEFERYQLRLDILQTRLSRWAEASGIIHKMSGVPDPLIIEEETPIYPERIPAGQERTAVEVLAAIQDTLYKARRDATRMKADLTACCLQPRGADRCAPLGRQKLQLQMMGFLERRRVETAKMIGGMKWTFYKRDHFDRLIADISTLVADLEKLVNNQARERL